MQLSSVLSQSTRLTDGQTDGQTEFPSLYRICIPCSAVKNTGLVVWHIPVQVINASVATMNRHWADLSQTPLAHSITCRYRDLIQ